MFKKILIANRGEIALRVIRSCKKMGIKTVAIYSEADTNALHVTAADEAVYIGPSPANQSYLSIPRIIDAIRVTGADAVHPGYGFLSENAEFVDAVRRVGATFIGPTSEAMRRMGDKIEAKIEAKKAKVSTVPGFEGEITSSREAQRVAAKIGFPVMFKAAAGGGGKGMRIVRSKEEVDQSFRLTTTEAKKSFGDDRVFIEKYIDNPRHIEIQIIADKHGNILCLGERECSIQRHNQKVVEEAPSCFLDDRTRKKMYEQSIALAKQVGYISAGTIEFICDQERNFYFLEMNTRLQVEHPVTEFITGLDLVEWMIRVANGEKLPITQEELKLKGWSIECRIYAEDPQRGFLPSVGRITEYKEPEKNAQVRVESGVYAGGEVSMFYDAMISKLITYGETRTDAIKNMQQALSSYVINGISHNISFLEALMAHPRFAEGRLSAKFIEQEYPDGFSGAALDEEKTKNLVAVGTFIYLKDAYRAAKTDGQLPGRERHISTRWVVSVDDNEYWVNVRPRPEGFEIQTNESRFSVYAQWSIGSKLFQGQVDGKNCFVHITSIPGGYILNHAGTTARITVRSPRVAELGKHMPKSTYNLRGTNVLAPISGIVTSIKVTEGEVVAKGQELLILEAMKMENVIYSERDAKISKIIVSEGQSVQVNDTMIEFSDDIAKE